MILSPVDDKGYRSRRYDDPISRGIVQGEDGDFEKRKGVEEASRNHKAPLDQERKVRMEDWRFASCDKEIKEAHWDGNWSRPPGCQKRASRNSRISF